jgi:hypothetical protein
MSSQDDNTPDDLVQEGAWGAVRYATDANGDMPAKEFVDGLDPAERRKVVVLFERIAEKGQIHNREQFKKLRGDIYEFKRFQIRIACFQEGRNWLLVYGLRKKKDKWRESDLERAERIISEHRQRRDRQ